MCRCAQLESHVQLFVNPWTVAHQAPLSKWEYWSGLPFPSPGDLPNPRNQGTCISCTGRQILYHWATWEATIYLIPIKLFRLSLSSWVSFGHLYLSRNLSFLSKLSNLGWQSTLNIFEDPLSSSLHCFPIQNLLSSFFVFLHIVCLLKKLFHLFIIFGCTGSSLLHIGFH